MIAILNHGMLLRGLKLLKYQQKLASNFKYCLSSTTSWSSNVRAVKESPYYPNSRQRTQKTVKLQTSFGIPLSYESIYVSHEYHTFIQHFFTLIPTGVTILGVIQLLLDYEALLPDLFTSALHLWVIAVFYWTSVGSAVVGYRTPIRIYHEKETGIYKAVFNDLIPTKHRIIEFTKGSVTQIEPNDELTLFKNSRFIIKGHKVYMFLDYFRYPADLYKMFSETQNRY